MRRIARPERTDFLHEAWTNDSLLEVRLPDELRDAFARYVCDLHDRENPYFSKSTVAYEAAFHLFGQLLDLHDRDPTEDTEKLLQIIYAASEGKNLPPIEIKNGLREPDGSLVPPPPNRGFDYGGNPQDRMKLHFYTEWFAWTVAVLLNHENTVHPSEHGGSNRFHAISPIPEQDDVLRTVGASTGGGVFRQHNDATVYNPFLSEADFSRQLSGLNTDLVVVTDRINRSGVPVERDDVVRQVLCGKYIRVDALTLSGVLNVETHTHIGTPAQIQSHLHSMGLTSDDLRTLSRMPVAHLAGPADGEMSYYVGTVAPPIFLDADGDIFGLWANSEDNRMVYVGNEDSEETLFKTFLDGLRSMPVHELLLESGNLLFIPNTAHGLQQSVTHGRESLSPKEYNIDIGMDRPARRHQSRQYTVSRARDRKESFLQKYDRAPLPIHR